MKIEFAQIADGVNDRAIDLITKKINKLEKFHDNLVHTVVYLTDESPASKAIEIKIIVKDSTLFVKETAETFEEASDKAVETMKRQIKKYKDRLLEK